jgi:Flp pilus assembly protein TadG
VLLTPIFLLLLDLAVLGGRLTESQSRVDGAAHAGARAASLQRTVAGANAAAQQAVAGTLAGGGPSCTTYGVTVDTAAFRAGGAVTVSVHCSVSLHDLSWFPLPGARTVIGTSVSAIDTYRGTAP